MSKKIYKYEFKNEYKLMIDIIEYTKDKKKFISTLETISVDSIELAIKALKVSGVCVNTHEVSNDRYNLLVEESLSKIKSNIKNDSERKFIDDFKRDRDILNKLYSDFYSKDIHKDIKSIPDRYKLFAYLILIENSLRILSNTTDNYYASHLINIDFRKKDKDGIRNLHQLNAKEVADMHDRYIENASEALYAILFYKYTYNDKKKFNHCPIDEQIETKYIYTSMNHNDLVDVLRIINDVHEKWRFGYISLNIKDNKVISETKDTKAILQSDLMDFRFDSEHLSTQFNTLGKNFKCDIKEKRLIPEGYLDEGEFIDKEYCKTYLQVNDFNTEINQVPLNQWMRAYAVIRMISKNFIRNNKPKNKSDLKSWVIITNYASLRAKFENHGVDKEYVDKILNSLKFNKTSRDILASPIIEIEDRLIIIPSICRCMIGATSVLKLASSQNWDISFKGENFEFFVKKILDEAEIKNCSLKKYHEGGEVYQCDVLFNLDKDLYFIECKNVSQPFGYYSKTRLLSYQEDFKQQIERISNFYRDHLNYVKDGLSLSQEWKPRNIYNIILYSCKLGSSYQEGSNIITDINIFKSIVLKEHASLRKNGKPICLITDKDLDYIYRGKLTTNKFLKGIKEPYKIKLQRINLIEHVIEIEVNDLTLIYRDNRKKDSEVIIMRK